MTYRTPPSSPAARERHGQASGATTHDRALLMHERRGVIDLTDEERAELSHELRAKIATELQATT